MDIPTLPEERRQQILEFLLQEGKVVATNLSQTLQVSEDTIRRDLRELDEAGLLTRVHGGALPRSPGVPSYAIRQGRNVSAKVGIAKRAAQLVRSGQLVILDSGTTTEEVARQLPRELEATFVTNSPGIALALSELPRVDVIMTGGKLDKTSQVLSGAATLDSLHNFRADLCLLGICSLHPEAGVTALEYEEAQVKRAMVLNTADVVALSTAEKLGTAAPYVVSPLSELTQIITERNVSDETLTPYKELGLTVTRA